MIMTEDPTRFLKSKKKKKKKKKLAHQRFVTHRRLVDDLSVVHAMSEGCRAKTPEPGVHGLLDPKVKLGGAGVEPGQVRVVEIR